MPKPGITIEAQGRAVGEGILAGKLGGLSLPRQVITLAFWPLLENSLGFLVGLTDLLVSSRIADGAEQTAILDAMGFCTYIIWFLNILQGAISMGVMALVSRAMGARDPMLANRGLGQGVWLGLAAGMISSVTIYFGLDLLIETVALKQEAAVQAARFLHVYAFTCPLSGLMFSITASLRAAGDTRTPFIAMVVVNLVNMAASWLLVFGPAPLGGHGTGGIACGTLVGWTCGLATSVVMLGRQGASGLRWSRFALTPHMETMQRIIRVGWPQFFEIMVMWSIQFYGIRVISGSPVTGALAAHNLAVRAESMSSMPGFAIATAAAALTGQYLGAGSKEMAVKAVRFCWKLGAGMMTAIGLGFVFFRHGLIALMAPGNPDLVDLAAPLLLISAFAQPFTATCIILKTSMRGAGATSAVMRWSFGSMLFDRVGLLWWFSSPGGISLGHVWYILCTDLFTQALVFAWLHFRGRWLDARV